MKRTRPTPTDQVLLHGFHPYLDLPECLEFIWRAMARLDLEEDDLLPYQSEILRDLADPFDEEALAAMLRYWEYDIRKLVERGRGSGAGAARPRVDLEVELTSKGNLKVEWFPQGYTIWGAPLGDHESDFVYWRRDESRGAGFGGRPSNELFFIHGVRSAVSTVDNPDRAYSHPLRELDHILLQACLGVVKRLKDRLDYSFEVSMRRDIFVEYTPEFEMRDRRHSPPPKIVKWEIADPKRKQAEADDVEIAKMGERIGVNAEELLRLWSEIEIEAAGDRRADVAARTAKRLRDGGIDVKKPAIEREYALIQRRKRFRGAIADFSSSN